MKKSEITTRRISSRAKAKRQKAVFTTILLLTVSVLLVGVYAIGTKLDLFGGASSVSSIASSQSLSSSSEEPTTDPTQTATPEPPTATPKPTSPPVTLSALSNARLGWSYTSGGVEGVLATNTASRIDMCNRFGGIWQGDTTVKKVYITTDIGYDFNNNTEKMLNIAQEKDFTITFFVVGTEFKQERLKPIFQRMYNEGHLIANHSWNHAMYWNLYGEQGRAALESDVKKVEDEFLSLTGAPMEKFFRYPSGEYSEATMAIMNELGYKSVFWTFAYVDWIRDDQPDPAESLQKMINGIHNGAIFLLHEVSNTNIEVLPELIDEIRARGYEIGDIRDLG